MTERRSYLAYGLVIELPFACPPLPSAPDGAPADVTVLESAVPRRMEKPVASDDRWDATRGRLLFRGGGHSGRFLVEGGDRVLLQRNPEAREPLLAFHFLHTVMPAVLRHRGMVVLHANVGLTPAGSGVVVTGESGAGKSTALAELVARGCGMVADDIAAARMRPDGTVEIVPGVAQLHLTEESAVAVGAETAGLPRYRWRRMKAAVPVETNMVDAPVLPGAVYVLRLGSGSELQASRLEGRAKFDALLACLHGPVLREEHPAHLAALGALAEQAPVIVVDRPAERWTADEVADLILAGGV
jgi:hypothetical protein